MNDELLTAKEVADVLRVSDQTVFRLIEAGELHAFRVGRQWRIRRSDLDAFIAA